MSFLNNEDQVRPLIEHNSLFYLSDPADLSAWRAAKSD